jgi:hypothetical protein
VTVFKGSTGDFLAHLKREESKMGDQPTERRLNKHRPWTGYLLAGIGVAVLLSEVSLHYYGYFHHTEYTLNHPVLYVGLVIGFVGFYMINPKGAESGTNILSRTVIGLIEVVRTGKRAEDVKVEVTATRETPIPVAVKPPTTGEAG